MRRYIYIFVSFFMLFACQKQLKYLKIKKEITISIKDAIELKNIYCINYNLNESDYYKYPIAVDSFYIFHNKLPSKEKLAAKMGIWININSGKCFSPIQEKNSEDSIPFFLSYRRLAQGHHATKEQREGFYRMYSILYTVKKSNDAENAKNFGLTAETIDENGNIVTKDDYYPFLRRA